MIRCPHDGLTKGKMDTRIQHENEPSQGLRAIFWHAKDFATTHEVAAGAWKTPPAVIRWLKMPSRMARCFYDQSRIWTFSLSCVHLMSTSGQCDASIRIGNELGKNWERSEEVTFEGNWKSMALSAACHLVDWRHTFQWLWSAFAHLFYEFKLKLFTPKLLLSVNTLFVRRTLVLNNIEPADLAIGMANLCYPW